MQIDIRTVMLLAIVTVSTCTLLLAELWWQNRRYSGLLILVADFFAVLLGLLLVTSRGWIPDWASMVLANTLTVSGSVLGYMGLLRFFGEKRRQAFNLGLVALFPMVHAYYAYVQPSLRMRTLNLSLALFLVCLQCAWFLWRHPARELRTPTRWLGVLFGVCGLVSLARMWHTVLGFPQGSDFFHSGNFDALALISYQIFFIFLTHTLALMVNRRLLGEISAQEEKFSKAFHTAPYAMAITRLKDGFVLDVNEGFTEISGYRRDELIGKNTRDLFLWENPMDREKLVDLLQSKDRVRGVDHRFRRKDGSRLDGNVSAALISFGGETYALSSIADITARKKAEDEVRNLLREKEILLAEIHHRVKNNLGAIGSLLYLQIQRLQNAEAISALQDAESRVRSMLILYDRLHRTGAQRAISLELYLAPLAREIIDMFPGGERVHVDTEIDDTVLGVRETVPLGLIVNELLTNAMKYAFQEREEGHILLSAHRSGGKLVLVLQDDGRGIPSAVDVENSPGFGLQVAHMLTLQLEGTIRIERGRGTRFVIEIPLPEEGEKID